MGIEFTMWQITTEEIDKFMELEETINDFVESQFPETYDDDFEDNALSLDRIWHLLHYLITGEEEGEKYPLAFAIRVGHFLHESWSEMSWIAPNEVRDVAEALAVLSEEDLRKRGGEDSMSKVNIYKYPGALSEDDFIDVLMEFNRLKGYYKDASEKGNAMLRFFH